MKKIALMFVVFITALTPILASSVNEVISKYGNNPKGWSALNYAIEEKDFEAALILIDYVRDFNKVDEYLNPLCRLLYKASISTSKKLTVEQHAIIDRLLQKGLNNAVMEKTNQRPLYFAICLGERDVVIKLLNNGLSGYENNGKTFCYAVESSNYEMVQLLIEHGVRVREVKGSPLDCAVRESNYEMVQLLIKHGADVNGLHGFPLHWAIGNLDYDIAKLLIAHGATVEAIGGATIPPIWYAVLHGQVEGVRLLLENRANPNTIIKSKTGDVSILSLALSKNMEVPDPAREEIIDLLIQYGAKLL